MSKISIVDNEFASSWCYPEEKIIHHQFHKFPFGNDFRNVMIKDTEFFEEYGCDKWLSDDRDIGVLHPDDKKWGEENWLPRVMKAGWKYWALILPTRITGQMSLYNLVDEFSKLGVVVKVFEDPNEALEWLKSLN